MTRSAPVLSQHLLTRSDLARLEIPAGRILAWLADGWLDQMGSLPGNAHDDPVFAVLSRELRLDLAARLAAIGKDAIVFTPARVRSVLLRAMMSPRPVTEVLEVAVAIPAPVPQTADATSDTVIDAVPGALEATARILEHEVDAFVEMTRQEAQLDAIELAKSVSESGRGEDVSDDVDCFNAEDLFGELDSWGSPEVPASTNSDSRAEEPLPDPGAVEPTFAPEMSERTDLESEPLPSVAVEETMQEPTNEAQMTVPDVEPSLAMSDPESAFVPERTAESVSASESPIVGTADVESRSPNTNDDTLADLILDSAVPEASAAPVDPSLATATVARVEPSEDALALRRESADSTSAQAMTRVESFLGELRHVLVELANRPQFQTVDMQPLVTAVRSGFVQSAEGTSAANLAISSLAERVGDFGKRVEVGVALAVRTALEHESASNAAHSRPASFVVARTDRSTITLFGIGFLLLCWTAIFWFKTSSPRLALGTLVGANLIGCCLLAGRRRSS